MSKFEVGQKVRVRESYPYSHHTEYDMRGRQATVVGDEGNMIACAFEGFTLGHAGNTGALREDIWYIETMYLEPVKDTTPAKEKGCYRIGHTYSCFETLEEALEVAIQEGEQVTIWKEVAYIEPAFTVTELA
jgi:hypothetical protein